MCDYVRFWLFPDVLRPKPARPPYPRNRTSAETVASGEYMARGLGIVQFREDQTRDDTRDHGHRPDERGYRYEPNKKENIQHHIIW
jgi:hypothetical protein